VDLLQDSGLNFQLSHNRIAISGNRRQVCKSKEGAMPRVTRPELPDGPHVRYRLETTAQIPEAVHRFLPEVERDPRLHALSFVDPLAVAEELGIAVSPAVARVVRRGLAGAVTFDRRSLDDDGRLRGLGTIRWRPKPLPDGGRR
jgi:hypothetical protein